MPKVYVVQPNDTLWGIVTSQCPEVSPQKAINEIVKANNLANPNLILVDQQLIVPCLDEEEVVLPQPLDGTILLNVPYFSQNDTNSNYSSTDCGPTCVRMLIGWNRIKNGLKDTIKPTVNELCKQNGKPPNVLMGFDDLIAMTGDLGPDLDYWSPANIQWIKSEIQQQRPVISLCHYGTIKPALSSWTKGHFVVIVGYSPTEIYFHDPNCLGSPYRSVPQAVFDCAIGPDNLIDGNGAYQALRVA
ncbi:MAG: C39 family peptidase [Chloroflexi bacterium]|nr:C39 family peptidase [Chloroflexota bacterium]